MKIENCIYLIFLIYSSQYYVVAAKYSKPLQRDFVDKIIAWIEKTQNEIGTNLGEQSDNPENKVDPNDRVPVEKWNKVIDADMKKMPATDDYSTETAAYKWLEWYFRVAERYNQVNKHFIWNYETNVTDENLEAQTAESLKMLSFTRLSVPIAKKFNKYMKDSDNEDLKRIFFRLSQTIISHDEKSVKKASKLGADILTIYLTTEVCELNDSETCYPSSPYLSNLMATETDYDRLAWAWKGWQDNCGNRIRPLYLPYIDILNKDAKENGYEDLAESWIENYEMGNETEFQDIVDQSLEDLMPLYKQLHAYVRGRLCELYPGRFDCNGPIPAHILGSTSGNYWSARLDDFLPYPDTPLVNLTHILRKKHYTVKRIFETAEDFFTSINLYPMTPKFWARSILTKPKDRLIKDGGKAYDMDYHEDYRIRLGTIVSGGDFNIVHHEMGHIEYIMSYAETQSYAYREGANSAFHEAIGDTIALYADSLTHSVKLGFIDEKTINSHYKINHLMKMALDKVAGVPLLHAVDTYRFALFRNKINRRRELNAKWWELRIQNGGIMPPVPRSDPENFDPATIGLVVENIPYFRYFIGQILQFQFYRGMCRLQGHKGPLHMCDIYGNKRVGERFKQMLAMGNSKPWSEILKSLTGEDKLEPSAMLDYFEPLHKWLKMENAAQGYPVGWK